MALLSKQILKSPFLSYLYLGFIGATSVLAFSPFNFKPIIVISLSIFVAAIINSENFWQAFKRSVAWGLGYWIAGTGWLIVSIYYYGNTSIIISISIILIMGSLLSIVFIAPFSIIKLLNIDANLFIKSLVFASLLTLLELLRFVLLGGFPWLLPGLVLLDTAGQNIIPILGVYGGSFILYFLSFVIALSFLNKQYRIFLITISSLVIFLPQHNLTIFYPKESLSISIIQPSLDPFKKYVDGLHKNIEDVLVDLSGQQSNVDLLIWPESPLPYLHSSNQMANFNSRIDGLPEILSGAWKYQDSSLYNTMTILSTDESYAKRHLVPFGEYVPFENLLRGIIDFFDMPMSSISAGMPNQELLNTNNFKILGMICFDIAFPLSYIHQMREADFIVNISNDTWFGNSYGPYQHLQIVRARALESNKWIARGTSDGISTIVDNKGTIVSKISKGTKGALNGRIYKTQETSFFYEWGYSIIPLISLIMFIFMFVVRSRK